MPWMPFVRSAVAAGSRRAMTLSFVLVAALAVVPNSARAETGAPPVYNPEAQVAPQAPAAAPPQASPDAGDTADDGYPDTDPSALRDFRQPLAPYGQWIQDPTYGTVWVPDSTQVGSDFAPYQTGGQWATDDNGEWMWQSDYDWGYIPFHYGRWVWAGSNWAWVPGRRYAPAWVTWRVGEGGYLGWAPLPPTWYWSNGMAVGLYTTPYAAYCFVPTNYVFYNNVSRFVVHDRGVVEMAARSTHAYRPAMPSVGRGGATPRDARRSPTLSEAHVPASAAPRTRASADARSMAFATRSSTAAVRRGYAQPASRAWATPHGFQRGGGDAWRSSYPSSRMQSPSIRTPSPSPAFRSSAPSFSTPHASHGSSFRAPAAHSAPSVSHSSGPHFSGGRAGGGGRRR